MNLFTRLSATLSATASHTAARFENHRAIGRIAIERAREGVAAARAAERHHRRQGESLEARRAATQGAIDTWTRRAREASDDATALQCLQRRQDERERFGALDESLQRHAAETHRLSERLRELERGLDAMVERYESLASRETLAQAGAVIESTGGAHLDEAFERWETRVDIAEMTTPGIESRHPRTGLNDGSVHRLDQDHHHDALEHRLADEERRRLLADELQALRAESEDKR